MSAAQERTLIYRAQLFDRAWRSWWVPRPLSRQYFEALATCAERYDEITGGGWTLVPRHSLGAYITYAVGTLPVHTRNEFIHLTGGTR